MDTKSTLPFFSIIIPLYNKQYFISDTLHSVFSQSFDDYEVIVVNDGSTDKSLEVLSGFVDDRLQIIEQKNQGVSIARNNGILLAKGSYITFLDADDYWYPDFLKTFYDLTQKFPHYLVFSGAIEIETNNKIIPAQYSISNKIAPNIYIENYFKASKKQSIICTSCAVFNREIFYEIGHFDPFIRSGQDIDLWIRIGIKHPVLFIDKVLAKYVYDSKSLSRKQHLKATVKLKYDKFAEEERNNIPLHIFLNYNRYSEAMSNKILGEKDNYKYLKKNIDLGNLPIRKIVLLHLPAFVLRILYHSQSLLVWLRIRKTVFK